MQLPIYTLSTEEIGMHKQWIKEINRALFFEKENRHEVAKSWFPDDTNDSLSIKDIVSRLKTKKKELKEEIALTDALNEYRSIVESLLLDGKVSISCFGDSVSEDDKLNFILPLIHRGRENHDSNDIKERNSLLKGASKLHCQVNDRYAKGYDVFYSGEVFVVKGEERIIIASFANVNNGFAVRLG